MIASDQRAPIGVLLRAAPGGSYLTAGDGVDRAAFTVGVDLAQVDLLVDGSSHHQATVKVYPSVPVGLVVYTVTGHYDVTAVEPGFAATEANSYLYPDLSHLVGV